ILTFFEFPDAAPGRAGAGMIHQLRWRIGSPEALEFWAERLAREGAVFDGGGDEWTLRFRDPEGLGLELAVVETDDEPLRADAEDIPAEHALLGFDGVRVYADVARRGGRLLTEVMGFAMTSPGEYRLAGRRHATYGYDDPPAAVGS